MITLPRPARMWPEAPPSAEVVVRAPPARSGGGGETLWPVLLFPLLALAGSVVFVLYSPSILFIAIAGILVLGSLVPVRTVGLVSQNDAILACKGAITAL